MIYEVWTGSWSPTDWLDAICGRPMSWDPHVQINCTWVLKLYCGYKYTRPCMINRIWGLKQLWLQMNGRFHLHGLYWTFRNGEGAKNSKLKYMFHAGFEPAPRNDMWISALDRLAKLVRYQVEYLYTNSILIYEYKWTCDNACMESLIANAKFCKQLLY